MPINKEQFQREADYGASAALAREMLESGIINRQDFLKIDKMYVQKYRPLLRPVPDDITRQST